MHPILKFAKTAYIESSHLKPLLREYSNPDDFISRLVKKGDLIRLKKGFFVIADIINERGIPFEQIANLLYGPSYLSYEWALSYYGLIPEGVYVMTNTSLVKSKHFNTPIGHFDYNGVSLNRYSIGFEQEENEAGGFLIASREKALADLIHLKSKGLEGKDLLIDLIEARRIDRADLKNLNLAHLKEISNRYRSKAVANLVKVLDFV